MRCEVEHIGENLYRCKRCKRLCRAPSPDVKMMCGKPGPKVARKLLNDKEAVELFGESDPTLIGNRVKAVCDAIGVPPCGSCQKRREWLNKAHAWVRSLGYSSG